MVALALRVRRALGCHPRNGLRVDLGRYRVPPGAVYPVCHHVSCLAASGESYNLFGQANCLYNEARLGRQLIFLPVRQESPENAGMLGGEGDGGNIVPSSVPDGLDPATLPVRAFGAKL